MRLYLLDHVSADKTGGKAAKANQQQPGEQFSHSIPAGGKLASPDCKLYCLLNCTLEADCGHCSFRQDERSTLG